jgi:hypothetical protein
MADECRMSVLGQGSLPAFANNNRTTYRKVLHKGQLMCFIRFCVQ